MRTSHEQEEEKFMAEVQELRSDMTAKGTSRSQDVMGEAISVRKVHTKEMSRLFKSKNEIYNVLLIEGQYYLPPFEECTIDFMRDVFKGRRKVSAAVELQFLLGVDSIHSISIFQSADAACRSFTTRNSR